MRKLLLTIGVAAASLTGWAAPIITTTSLPTVTVERIISDSTTGTQGVQSLAVGLIQFSIQGGGSLAAYCIEPQQNIPGVGVSAEYFPFTLATWSGNVGPISATRQTQIRQLFGAVANPFSTSLSTVTQAAIQVALWEIVRENSGTLNVTAGTTRFQNASDAAVLTQAQNLLNGLSGAGANNLGVLNHPTFQDLIIQGSPDVVTPEPSTVTMLGFGALALAAAAARRRK